MRIIIKTTPYININPNFWISKMVKQYTYLGLISLNGWRQDSLLQEWNKFIIYKKVNNKIIKKKSLSCFLLLNW